MTETTPQSTPQEETHATSTTNPFETAYPSTTTSNNDHVSMPSPSSRPGDVLEAHTVTTPPLPPPSTNAGPPAGAPDAEATPLLSPEVQSLQAMFPDFDPMILQSVLESVNGSQERATDVLLGMSDPSYVSQEQEHPQPQSQLTQTELDEQLARRLMMEDQQQQQQTDANWHPDQDYPQQQDPRGQRVPYQPRVQREGRTPPWDGQGTQGGGRDTMSEVSEQFNKIAESGKKTFSTLFTKVKAKMQEFDQSRSQGGSSTQQQSGWAPGQSQYNTDGPHNYQEQIRPDYMSSGQGRGNYPTPNSPPQSQWQAPPPRSQGYDATPAPQIPAPAPVNSPFSNTVSPAVPPTNPTSSGSLSSHQPPAGSPPGGGIDRSKLGLLPKRPVTLVDDVPAQPNPRHEDEDELDYVENPFEERR